MWLALLFLLGEQFPWTHQPIQRQITNLPTPSGFERVAVEPGSFGEWLRALPLKQRNQVYLYDGRLKPNQSAQFAVLDIDVGNRDLQQCADAALRLRAEYLYSANKPISFRYTSGFSSTWWDWRDGKRPVISGGRVSSVQKRGVDDSYTNFRRYLTNLFVYAGTLSLDRDMKTVADPQKIQIGDVFVQGGSPGHAVIVMDVVQNADGERRFMLAQSYMPAQEIHVLVNPSDGSSWYKAKTQGVLNTPEWRFNYSDLHRWPK